MIDRRFFLNGIGSTLVAPLIEPKEQTAELFFVHLSSQSKGHLKPTCAPWHPA
ncbi:MAG: hypothetical protein O3A32_09245 [Proteobacteria bacterium]|nr:hypothetical protein [Pseudomonadota bacterium]MDA1294922.1 hypothetical protein [Pseudomonadota bacterium]